MVGISAPQPIIKNRAFANFYWNGSAVVIVDSFNISSITRNSTGNYTVNFTSMPNANYGVGGSFTTTGGGSGSTVQPIAATNGGAPTLKSTTQCTISLSNPSGSGNLDPSAANSCYILFYGK